MPLKEFKAREFQKNIYFHFIEYAKVFVWITTNCKIFLKRWEYQTTFPASREICVQVKKQQWEVDVEQWTGSKLGKEYTKATYCHLAYLTYMHSTSCKMPGWMKFKWETRLPGEISTTSDMQMTPCGRKQRETKQPLDEDERGEWKSGLKLYSQKH